MQEQIKTLMAMRAELQSRIDALTLAINTLTDINNQFNDTPINDTSIINTPSTNTPKKKRSTRKGASRTSADFVPEMSNPEIFGIVPDINRGGGGIRTDT